MKRSEHVCLVVEENRQAVERQLGDLDTGLLESYADALRAEADLPDRRPDWTQWARKRARQAVALMEKIDEFLGEEGPE